MAQAGRDDDRAANALHAPVAKGNAGYGWLGAWFWTLLLAAMLVIGGANIAYPLMRILCGGLGALAIAIAVTSRTSRWSRPGWTDWIVLGIVLLFIIQMVPLPPALWTLLPGRESIAVIDREVFGALQWRPISIDTEATFQTSAFLIPFLGIYLAWRSGDEDRREGMVRGVWIALAIALALGLLQLAGLDMLHPYPVPRRPIFASAPPRWEPVRALRPRRRSSIMAVPARPRIRRPCAGCCAPRSILRASTCGPPLPEWSTCCSSSPQCCAAPHTA